MATFNSNTYHKGTVYRCDSQEAEQTVEFKIVIGSGVTLTDGDFINLFTLGDGHDIVEMAFQSSDALDTGTAALECDCGWAQATDNDGNVISADTNYGATVVFDCSGSTAFETDPVDFIAAQSTASGLVALANTATTGSYNRLVRLEVAITANAATDTAATLQGYARIRRTPASAPDLTYGWDGEPV